MKIEKVIDFKKKFTKTYNKEPKPSELFQFRKWYCENKNLTHWSGKEVIKEL